MQVHLTPAQIERLFLTSSTFLEGHIKSKQTKLSLQQWKKLDKSLSRKGYNAQLRYALQIRISEHLRVWEAEGFRYRILHDLEKELIQPDAYGLLLRSSWLGLIPINDVDQLIESLVAQELTPISKGILLRELSRRWYDAMQLDDIEVN